MLELGRQGSILGGAGPVVGPSAVTVGTDVDHGLNREAHTGLGSAHSLILSVVRNVGCTVEQLVDTVAAVALDDTAVTTLGVLLNDIARFTEQHARLDQVN